MMKCATEMAIGMMKMATLAPRSMRRCTTKTDKHRSIADTLHEMGAFKTLLTAVEAAGMAPAFRRDGSITVFAPTDEAFAKLPSGTVESLLKDLASLKATLSRHVIAGQWKPEEWVDSLSIKTLEGERIQINVHDGKVTVGNASVVFANIKAGNGTIHVIDAVL